MSLKTKKRWKKAAGIIRAQASGISGADTAITSGQKHLLVEQVDHQ